MSTAARTYLGSDAHWYSRNGDPCHTVPRSDGKGDRKTTLADARKQGMLPSVTTILQVLDKPELNAWKQEQAVLAVLSTARLPGESLDAFVNRVLAVEKVQDQEAGAARKLGLEIHRAIQDALNDRKIPDLLLRPYVAPVLDWIAHTGQVLWTEKVLVGDGYAGKADLGLETEGMILVTDFKSCTNLPTKDSWPEHRLQTAAYAACLENDKCKRIATANVYISTRQPGKIISFIQFSWQITYAHGFVPIKKVWQWLKEYDPS